MVACITQADVAYYYATMGRFGGTRSEVVGDVWWLRCTAGQVATARREFHVHAWQGKASASRRLEVSWGACTCRSKKWIRGCWLKLRKGLDSVFDLLAGNAVYMLALVLRLPSPNRQPTSIIDAS